MDDERKSKVRLKGELDVMRKRLAEKERLYQSLIESNIFGIHEIDIYGNTTYINAAQCQILGYESRELKGREIWDMLASDPDRKSLTDYLTALSQKGHIHQIWTGIYKRNDESVVELKQHWTSRRDDHGNINGFVAVTSGMVTLGNADEDDDDGISDMDMTQAWMVGKDEKYRYIAESTMDLILIFDMKGKITYVNETGLDIIGYFEEELLDMNITDFLPPDVIDKVKSTLLKQYKTGVKKQILIDSEIINRNLKLLPMEMSLSLIVKMQEPAEIMIVGRDLTQRAKKKKK